MFNKILLYAKEHISEIFISVFFLGLLIVVTYYRGQVFTEPNIRYYVMPLIVTIGIFLTWLQFIFQKYNKKREAALTYFPRPMELEKIESEIDEVINFWSSSEVLDTYVVKLLVGEDINEYEYKLIWDKFSFSIKKDIILESNICNCENKKIFLDFKEEYKLIINDYYTKTRRKLNIYLNQIEGYCQSINNGNIDLKAAYNYSHKFTHQFRKARTYIDKVRILKNEKDLYIEFEKVIQKWEKR